MSKFKVGMHVTAYQYYFGMKHLWSGVGVIEHVYEDGALGIELETPHWTNQEGNIPAQYPINYIHMHPKACRRLVKKK